MPDSARYELDPAERESYARDGYLIRRDVFSPAEIEDMRKHSEALVAELVRDRKSRRYRVGSYVFDNDWLNHVTIKWEGDTDVVHGIEPFAHLSPALRDWAHDPRLVEPMRAMLGCDSPMLYTEKLNLKRPRHGGPNPLHQDYPYWVDSSDDASQIATTILYLDDSSVENGCTWVVPGSHKSGKWVTRTDTDEFGRNEIDVTAYPDVKPIPVELRAGSTVSFGAFLVHQSTPNASDKERRALLYSYQPAGRAHMMFWLRKYAEERAARKAAKAAAAAKT